LLEDGKKDQTVVREMRHGSIELREVKIIEKMDFNPVLVDRDDILDLSMDYSARGGLVDNHVNILGIRMQAEHKVEVIDNIRILVYPCESMMVYQSPFIKPVNATEDYGNIAKNSITMLEQKGEGIIVCCNDEIKGDIFELMAIDVRKTIEIILIKGPFGPHVLEIVLYLATAFFQFSDDTIGQFIRPLIAMMVGIEDEDVFC